MILRIARTAAVVPFLVGAATLAGAPSAAQRAPRGSIAGHVKLTGRIPGNPIIRMGMDPMCARLNAGKRVVQEIVAAEADGSVANVFVYLEGTFAKTPVPSTPVTLDQRGCVYVPRVMGARVGQVLEVRNDDNFLHNIHSLSAGANTFNVSEPAAGMTQRFTLKQPEIMLRIKCDIHSWMTTFVGVVDHPYFAVTRQDGTFEIPGVPPGSYTLAIWHERYGVLKRPVRVRSGTATRVDFSYSASEPAPGR